MNSDFGFIHDKLDIKILLLYILQRIGEPIPLDELSELTMCDGGISYFEYADCVDDLVRTEHIKLKDGKYSLTEKGRRNSATTENNLPFSVRIEAERSTHAFRVASDRGKMIKTFRMKKDDGGFTVRMSLSDGIGDVVSIDMIAMNESQAIEMERGFRKRAEGIYHDLVGIILGQADAE